MNRSGLTLIEILIALVIIAVAFMALANLQISNLKVTRDSKQASVATQIANNILERVAADVYGGAEPDFDIYDYFACTPGSEAALCSYGGVLPDTAFPDLTSDTFPGLDQYSYSVTIESLYTPPSAGETRSMEEFLNEGLVRATISVTGPSSLSFTSYLTCYDVSKTPVLEQGEPCPTPYDPNAAGG